MSALETLAEVAAWWCRQMRALLPGLAAQPGHLPDALIIAVTQGDDVPAGQVLLRHNGVETPLHRLEAHKPLPALPGPLPVALRLPRGAVLCRSVELPIGAARDLAAVIGFEIDRLTPFSREEVFWGISGVTQDRARGRIALQLSIALRQPVETLLQALARRGLTPSCIEAGTGQIDLTPRHKRQRRGLRNSLQNSLPLASGLILLACLALPFIRQQLTLDAQAGTIAAFQPATATAQALRRQLLAAAAGRAAIAQARRAGDALQVLSLLTAALPDGSWLSDLTLKSGDLSFDGQSADAAQLIGLLSALRGLHDVSFTAPVTRMADGKTEQFSMHAEVVP